MLATPVNQTSDWEQLISTMLNSVDRFRRKGGFHWGDLLNKRGLTRLGRRRVPIIDARVDEWLAEGYIRLVFGTGPWVQTLRKEGNTGLEHPREGVAPSMERGSLSKKIFSSDGATPHLRIHVLVYGPRLDIARLRRNWAGRTRGSGLVEVRLVVDPADYICHITQSQISDQTRLPGAVRALLYHRRAQRRLKLRFHLGTSHRIQEDAERTWRDLGQQALDDAATELHLNLNEASETELMAWSSLTNHDKSTSETLLDRRAQLRQQYFTRLLPLWISKHREHLARNFNIDGGAIAVLNLVKGPSIRPSKFTRDAEREGDNVLELLQCIRDGQSANSQELADIKKLLGEKIPLLEGVAEDVRHVLNLMERRCELSDVEFRRECNRLARRLQSHRIN